MSQGPKGGQSGAPAGGQQSIQQQIASLQANGGGQAPQGQVGNQNAAITGRGLPSGQQAGANPYLQASNGMQSAYDTTQAALNRNTYNPINASLQGAAPTIASQMDNYRNPYENQVVQGLERDANRQLGIMQTQNAASADAAGAYGGSRHGLVEAETNALVNNNLQNNIANLRQQGFRDQAQFAGQDVSNQLGVAGANQNASNMTNQFNAGLRQNQFDNAMQGAAQQGNLAQASFGMGSSLTNQQMQQGQMAQQLMQSLMNQAQG